jgi:serine/threonine protein kinase
MIQVSENYMTTPLTLYVNSNRDVIHGDVKPSNILVYRGTNGEVVPKIADFGHSSLGRTDDAYVKLPFSPFFNAPDYHEHYFHLRDAKKFDAYNFGLIVYWLLVGRKMGLEEVSFLRSIPFCHDSILVADRVTAERDLRDDRKADLQTFFRATLPDRHQERSADWDYLLPLLGEGVLCSMNPRLESSTKGRGIAELISLHGTSEEDSHPKFTVSCQVNYLCSPTDNNSFDIT